MEEYRADSFRVTIADKIATNNYLHIKGSITGVGVFKYPQKNGTIRRELRPPEEVFRADSMATLKSVPIVSVLDHVKTMMGVDPSWNEDMRIVGSVGENITKNTNNCLDASLTIYDKNTIQDAIENPDLQLTAGYKLTKPLDHTSGVYEGEPYDAIQRGIVYGHVTLVKRGRAGSRCQIRADSAGDLINKKEEKMIPKIREIPALEIGEFRADAVEFEDSTGAGKLLERSVKLALALKASFLRADTAEGELSVLKKTNKDLEAKVEGAVAPDQFRADLKESLELLTMAKEIGLDVKDDLTPKGLKLAICSKIDPTMEARADMSEGFLDGAFGQIKLNWAQRIKEQKTINGVQAALSQDKAASTTEYEDHGNI